MKGEVNIPENENDIGNIDAEELATNQEGQTIPWFCGTTRLGIRWISPIYDQFHKPIPQTSGGKGK